jgi:pimeloyl-ACP methyl ester carboxylesterase
MPQTRYARSGDVSIAYQVLGEGDRDLVVVPGSTSNVEYVWDTPGWGRVFRELAANTRVIAFDKRGTGMSDPVGGAPTLETRMDDVRAVMDAVKSERAALVGVSEGAPMCILFAATYPDRAWGLVLYGGVARATWAPGYPWAPNEEEYLREMREAVEAFRAAPDDVITGAIRDGAAGATDDEVARYLPFMRHGTTPATWEALDRMNLGIDVRDIPSAVRAPTLVIHQVDDPWVPVEVGRYLAGRIPNARMVELAGAGHLLTAATCPPVFEHVSRFLDEADAVSLAHEPDRALVTVLFTDMVSSTEKAAELGDSRWRDLVREHHRIVRGELARFRGREVDTAGDGFLAAFDGPARGIRCALAVVDAVRPLGVEVRAGLHTGECELVDGKPAGLAVHIGARVAAQAGPAEVVVSQTVRDLVAGSGIEFRERPPAPLKGVPGEWRLHTVTPDGAASR